MDTEIVMKNLYDSEINCSINSFWDNHWDVKLGDEMNGFGAEGNPRDAGRMRGFPRPRGEEAFPGIVVRTRQSRASQA